MPEPPIDPPSKDWDEREAEIEAIEREAIDRADRALHEHKEV